MFGRFKRARLARAALEQLELKADGYRHQAAGAYEEIERLQRRLTDAERSREAMRTRLADANAELARELDEAAQALTAERTEREQAERSRDRAQAQTLDLQRWREKERDTLAAFVSALADAAALGTLHRDLVAPFERAAALLEDPEA